MQNRELRTRVLTIKLEPSLEEKLRKMAAERGHSMSSYMRRLVITHCIDNQNMTQEELSQLAS